MAGPESNDVRLGVVVPAHRQPQFLAGAVMSAVRQVDGTPGVGVVIVNDGCPFASTESIGLELRAAYPERVRYVRQPNEGLSAARNTGVREALSAWPALEAVFPLDADNRVSADTLGHLWRVLRSDPGAAWAYPAVEPFGVPGPVWETRGRFSLYRQLFENQCDAGSLIAREVFDRGIFFDEGMRSGYEDWEFFLRAARAGLRGTGGGRSGFRYRVRSRSMFHTARSRHDEIYAEVRDRHRDAFDARELTRLEHADLPRFALVSSDTLEVKLTSCADLTSRATDLAELAASVERGDAPPITVIGSARLWPVLHEARLLPGLLLRTQELLRRHPVCGLTLVRQAARGAGIAERHGVRGRPVHAVLAETASALALGEWQPDVVLELRLGASDLPPALPAQPLPELRAAGAAARPPTGASNTAFGRFKHVERLESTFPHSGGAGRPRALWVIAGTPPDTGAVTLAAALRASGEVGAVHLVLTDGDFPGAEGLDTVTLLEGLGRDVARELLARVMDSADVVLNAGSALGYEALALRGRDDGAAVQIALSGQSSPVLDEGLAALREVEDLVDVVLARSAHIAHRLENHDVVPDKIAVVDLGDPAAAAGVAARALERAAAWPVPA